MKSHVQVTNCTVIPETNLPGGGVAICVCESLLNNCQSSDICLRNILCVDNDCFESIFIELQIGKHEKSMSVVCIKCRIPASAILMTISHSYWEISPVKLYTYVVITI